MNKIRLLAIIAAGAVLLSFCGFYFSEIKYSCEAVSAESNQKAEEFSLSKAKLCLKFCSVSYYPETLEAKLKEYDYEDFKYFSRNQYSPEGNGIAFSLALSKTTENTTLIAVFRGTHLGEWYSNFDIGTDTEHTGFSAAADFASEQVESYIIEKSIDRANTKLLITGHSRGGAVANILAKRLHDTGSFSQITAYTFAAPNTTTSPDAHAPQYSSIFNILNPEDFICYIPLSDWGYTRYGVDMELPTDRTENYDTLYREMEKEFLSLTGNTHTGYENRHRDVEAFLSAAAAVAPSITDYYSGEISVPPHRVSLYEYMTKAAALLSGEDTLLSGMFLVSGANSQRLRPLTDFMLQGIDIEEFAASADLTKSAIGSAHTYETYLAWMNILGEEYFTNTEGIQTSPT